MAVSGGVDSVVLLDMVMSGALRQLQGRIIVAHFDHGMRETSAADARFVEALAQRYGVEFRTRREELSGGSEEVARQRRYAFLDEVAVECGGVLVTAHHGDDVVETMALNVRRGTRWRGMACMDDARRWRPLLGRTKSELMAYATERRLEWVEDETNRSGVYARNRVRKRLPALPFAAQERLREIRRAQIVLKQKIEQEIAEQNLPTENRYFLTMLPDAVARELLWAKFWREQGTSLLTRQLDQALLAIKTGRPRTRWQIGQGVEIELTLKTWHVRTARKVIK